ncbi:MAG: hypothetical protein US94_C0035G0009 [Berkelbacteria bacterium GW2011_GWB1_38_5]|uniref:Uncharacterized protein n=1 Tax=Berkelbacteria bacterium GW2011_GWB1_38_5 TaxID=1618336 RepID=A0A0G0K0E3_9BACT|nr:MAG: hypothetical protein US94_C0035G0009 [Berkelbacteria bacterium GW2011_GWB1_38_5]
MTPENSEQPDEIKFRAFQQELEDFNEETNNYIGMMTRRIYGGGVGLYNNVEVEKGLTEQDGEHFFQIWHNREEINSENYEFAVNFFRAIKEIFQELQEGKHNGKQFSNQELTG